jgi:signal transduction histidine kinase
VRLRATLIATLVVAGALGVTALVLVTALLSSLRSSADAEAQRRAEAAVPYALEMASGPARPLVDSTGTITVADPDIVVMSRSASGPLPTPDRVSVSLTPAESGAPAEAGETVPGSPSYWAGEGYTVASLTVDSPTGALLVQARASLDPTQHALDTLRTVLLPGIPTLLFVVALMTWFGVGRALAPVSAIRSRVAEITATDLHQRVPVPRSRDEIAALARTVNATLDRLEAAVDRHRRFVADAAHELRSPIATLRTRMELAEARGSAVADEALVDIERLQALAADLLLLARLDAAEPVPAEEADLGQVAAEEALAVRPRHEEVRVRLDIAPDVVVDGSPGHLTRLVRNLVDNAVRHARSTVDVRVAADSGRAVLMVRDDGPGIPPEHRESVFDRFTRLDEARARDAGGSGLGLSIARDIAAVHGGTLVVTDDGPGACLRASLPLSGRITSAPPRRRGRGAPKGRLLTGPSRI